MKAGIIFLSQANRDVDAHPYREIHERVTEDIVYADSVGFDYAWIAEHHASDAYGIMPDPLAYMAYLIPMTKRITLAAGVLVLPLHHPLRVVENISLLDILSSSRVAFGFGSGYREYEFKALGADFEARRAITAEALDAILEMFKSHRANRSGGRLPRMEVVGEYEIFPQCLSWPHPPFYMGAASEESVRRTARLGMGLLLSTLPPVREQAERTRMYLDACDEVADEHEGQPGFREIDIARFVYVADTDAEARRRSEEAVVRHIRDFSNPRTSGYLGTLSAKQKDTYSEITYDKLCEDTIIHGSPETVIEKIESLQGRTGATSIMLHFPPYYSREETQDCIGQFAENVLPQIRKIATSVETAR